MKYFKLLLIFLLTIIINSVSAKISVDICVYGGTSAGVIAAYKAKKLGKSVVLVEPGRNLGGVTSGGLGFTDYGDKSAIVGIAKDFYLRIGKSYGKTGEALTFEPHVAENVYNSYIKEENVSVLFDHRVISAKSLNKIITEIVVENSTHPQTDTNVVIDAKVFIDTSYEGDLMAKSNITYTFGIYI
jgi:flavin-dependent dehydrogenase